MTFSRLSFRIALAALTLALIPALMTPVARANEEPQWQHALSLFGSVKYPAGFKHFDYVNPNAPKGGSARQATSGTFDSFNIAIGYVRGNLAAGMTYIYDTLMASSLDEVSTEYGMIAEAVMHPEDFSWAKFRLNPQARWHDGKPITVEDVIYSLEASKKHSPQLAAYYRHVTKAEQTGEREVTFTFDSKGNRELPLILGQLIVLPKHWWEGKDANGRQRDIAATTLEPPLGSGAYRIKNFEPGRYITYERVPDYWAKDLNVNVGTNNFDELRIDYFRDATVALEAFRGDQVDWRFENSARNWATAYDFPAVRDGRVIKEEFPILSQGVMQAFAFNTRRDKFKDPRVRRAFNYAFDFEEMNKAMFYGQYIRIGSYFSGTELAWNWRPDPNSPSKPTAEPAAASGLPEGLELEILEPLRAQVPPRCSRPRTRTRPSTARTPCARTCARRRGCCARRATRSATGGWSMPRPVSRSPSRSCCASRHSSGWLCSYAPRWSGWGSRYGCGRSTTRNMKTVCGTGISTSSSRPGASRSPPATSSAAIGVRRPRTIQDRAISPASRILRSTP